MKTTVSLEQMKFIVGVVKNVKDVKETNHLGRIADKFNLNEHELIQQREFCSRLKANFSAVYCIVSSFQNIVLNRSDLPITTLRPQDVTSFSSFSQVYIYVI